MTIQNKIRLVDVAKEAGVSVGTVDRVVHNRGEVSKTTKQKVMSVLKDMNYTPNILAKSLASKKVQTIAVLIPKIDDNNPYWEKPLEGIHRAGAELRDYNTTIDIYEFNAADQASFIKASAKILKNKPEGVLLIPVFKNAAVQFSNQLEKLNIPYVFIDVNIETCNAITYYGQNAWQSGFVSGKILNYSISSNDTILILKLANKKVISHHIEKREMGFLDFFRTKSDKPINFISKEIDLLKPDELKDCLLQTKSNCSNLRGIFITGSRGYKVAEIIENEGLKDIEVIGYDLIDETIRNLKKGIISFLISQNPEEQAYKGVRALFSKLNSSINDQARINYSPINIIIKENLEYI